jgi:uncharacterized cysteine cluster protein YcgN (CxxCxxCC family)
VREPFWESKTLAEMNTAEWESLCDGCGRCCMLLLEDEKDRLYETNIACRLFDIARRRCTKYAQRTRLVKDCISLSADNAAALDWMPETCAYRRLAHGQGLPAWHPLITGTPDSVIAAGVTVPDAVPEKRVDPDDLWDYVTARRARARKRT